MQARHLNENTINLLLLDIRICIKNKHIIHRNVTFLQNKGEGYLMVANWREQIIYLFFSQFWRSTLRNCCLRYAYCTP